MQRKIVLASQSPRRKQLLEQIGLKNFEIQESAYEEDMTLDKSPIELAEFLSYKKAKEVASHHKDAIIIAGDTMVFLNNKVFGKPKTLVEARKMLEIFSGEKVGCVSGLAIIDTVTNKKIVTHDVGWIRMRKLPSGEIKNYLSSGDDILNVAGGFHLLSRGAVLVNGIEGDFYSIVGLPLTKLYTSLKKLGVDVLKNN